MLKQQVPMACNIENLCNTLVQTYNASILDRADEEFKDACLKEAKICTTTNKAKGGKLNRAVLAKLIDNKDKLIKPVSIFIGGPYTLTVHWHEIYKKLIYIFGEQHASITDCGVDDDEDEKFVGEYLYELIKNTDAFIDLYIELYGFKGEKYQRLFSDTESRHQNMFYLGKFFQECIQKSTRDLKDDCKLSRSHYFDLRASEGIKLNTVSSFNNELDTLLPELMNNDLTMNIEIFLNFFTQFEDIFLENNKVKNFNDFLGFWFNQIDQFELLQKKVSKSTNDVTEIIKAYIKEEIKIRIIELPTDYDMYWKDYDNIFKKIHKKYYKYDEDEDGFIYDFRGITMKENTELLSDLIKIHKYFILINSLIPDSYLLARLFKDFDIDSDKRPTDEPGQPHNIIIYAGNAHSNRYRKFLEEKLDFKLIEQAGVPWRASRATTGKFKNCIEMKEFQQPFFSNYPEVDWLTSKPPNLPKNPYTEWNQVTREDGTIYYEKEGLQTFKAPPDYYMGSKIQKNPDSVWKEAVQDGKIYYQHNTLEKIKQQHLPFDFYMSVDPEYRDVQRSETASSMEF